MTADTDTDTSTPCASVPVTYIVIPGRSRECSYFTQWVAHSIQGSTYRPLATHQLARSVSFTTGQFVETSVWLTVETVVITACWWGEGVRRHLSLVASTAPLGVGVTGRPVSGYSLSPPTLPTLSRILDHTALPRAAGDLARGRPARRVTSDRRECPLICCLMRPVNCSCWTCSDARNIGRYNSSRYDSIRYTQYRFRYDTDPIIVRSLVTVILTTLTF